ncbi:energy transducer TonB [Celeribacter neptunius]|uniref:Protein TonB n=1 Tax=Celeribacter neptunius TaxID=588602 RepID=A0A1I3IM77_9RHOB|nr:energy transducer TonB [Celeribacter neptunius]SFI49095.1 protein TonB [Celeribacter neptunius]
MSRLVEISAFVALSLGAHAALFGLPPEQGGAQSQGDGGSQLVSLTASTAALESLVERWDEFAPPELQAESAPPEAPEPPDPVAAEPALPLASPTPMHLDAPKMPMANLGLPTPPSESFEEPEAPEAPEPPKPQAPKPQASKPPKPQPPRSQNAVQSAGQTASGSGARGASGTAGTAQVATLDAGRVQRDLSTWGGKIRSAIERKKRYPSAARGAKGQVTLRITVARSGALRDVAISRSSGNSTLDQAALRAVQSVGQFRPAPDSLGKTSYTFTLQISFAPR